MKKILTGLSFLLALSLSTAAQDAPKASKFEKVSYHHLVKIDFVPGSWGRVQEILKAYVESGKAAGVKGPETFWLMTGDYDVIFVWELEGGTSDLEWDWSPNDLKWWSALVKLQGSEEKAKELQKEWASLIAKSTSEIARKPLE